MVKMQLLKYECLIHSLLCSKQNKIWVSDIWGVQNGTRFDTLDLAVKVETRYWFIMDVIVICCLSSTLFFVDQFLEYGVY